jgi:hypothetical protein
MRRPIPAFALAAALLVPTLSAQAPAPQPTTPAQACPPTTTLDELVKALDDAVSGPADKDRTCFRALFIPEARLSPLVTNKDDGSVAPRLLTVEGWIEAVRKRGSLVFYERQVKVKTETYGHLANLWSTYETRSTPDGKAEVRGINSIQAFFDGKRWKVTAILWQAETPAEPVPEKYLP